MDLNLLISIFTFSLLFSILFSIIIILAYPLFKDYYDSAFEGVFPVYNLFKVCRIVGYNEFIGFLFLIPGLNVLLTILIGARLKNMVNTYGFIKIGLIILPILFIPLAAYIRYSKPVKQEAHVEVQQEPEIETFEADEPEDNNDDSIFRIQKKTRDENENNKPYKAKKVMVNEEFINSAPAEQETIQKVEKKDN